MADERKPSPFQVLSVSRHADLDQVEATFARLYKAARRQTTSDGLRQELNAALETFRDPARRAEAEVRVYHLPLDPNMALPSAGLLVQELLPLELEPPAEPAAARLPEPPAAVLEQAIEAQPRASWPDDRVLLRQLAARVVLERLDPWADGER